MTYINGDVCVFYTVTIGNKELAPPPSLRLLEFEHDFDDQKLPEATFKFANHDQRLEQPVLKKYFKDGNLVKFVYGYIGELSRRYTYVMKTFEGFDVLTVRCYPHIKKMYDSQKRAWPNTTYSQVAEKMAATHGLEPDVQKTTEKYKSIQQENESDAKFLMRYAKQFHFIFAIDGKNLIWKPRKYDLAPSKSFGYRTGNPRDLIEFKPKQNTFQIPAGYELSGRNKKTGGMDTENGGVDDTKRTLLGGGLSIMGMGVDGEHVPGKTVSTQNILVYNKTTGETRSG